MRLPSQNRLWMRRPYTRLLGVGGHWYRAALADEDVGTPGPCAYTGCGLGRDDHWLEVGEWMLPRTERWARMARRARTRLTRKDRP